MKVYVLSHITNNYEGSQLCTPSVYSTLEKAKQGLLDEYHNLESCYEEVDEDESFIDKDGMSAFIKGSTGSVYNEMAGGDEWDGLQIDECELN